MKDMTLTSAGARLGELMPPRHWTAPRAADESFESTLQTAAAKGQPQLQDAAAKLVSSAFVLPVLASMHESPLRPSQGAFAPAAAEKRFAPMLDQKIADNVVKAAKFGLVASIVERFTSAQTRAVS
jgi:Rod binding domain-containing protein